MKNYTVLLTVLFYIIIFPAFSQDSSDANHNAIAESIEIGDTNEVISHIENENIGKENGLEYADIAVDNNQYAIARTLIEQLDIDFSRPIDPNNLNQSFLYSLSGKAADAYFQNNNKAAFEFLNYLMNNGQETARLFYFLSSSGCSERFDDLLELALQACASDPDTCTYPAYTKHEGSGIFIIDASRRAPKQEFLGYLDWRADYYPGGCIGKLKDATANLE